LSANPDACLKDIFLHKRISSGIVTRAFYGKDEHVFISTLRQSSGNFKLRLRKGATGCTAPFFGPRCAACQRKYRPALMPASKSVTGTVLSPENSVLTDLFDRTISYLRLSLTDRCNLKCLYCVPEEGGLPKLEQEDLLSYEELLRVVRAAVSMGMTKLRLTGGEPLVRRNVMDFVNQLAAIKQLRDIRITTNGVLLEHYAKGLRAAGISKINISLDSLQPERFARITGADCFVQVWQGIEKARSVGFAPVKLNMVVMRGVNDDELADFARLSRDTELHVRFIEFMPIGASSRWSKDTYVSSDEIKARLYDLGELIPVHRGETDGPASMFRLGADAKGKLGFISPLSHHFCDRCNRLRLTSEGMLRACLLHDAETDLRSLLRQGCTDAEIRAALLSAVRSKPQGHRMEERLREQEGGCHGRMSRIGG
jgi:cyclic pyranopterin phosphate synthase